MFKPSDLQFYFFLHKTGRKSVTHDDYGPVETGALYSRDIAYKAQLK
jgi:hypothetical protein